MSFLKRVLAGVLGSRGQRTDSPDKRTGSVRKPELITVGVDFGTSGTKVVFRNVLSKEQVVHVVDFGTSTPGFCRFSWPSTVAVGQNEMHFGDSAEGASRVRYRVFKAPKMELLRRGHSRIGADGPVDLFPGIGSLHEWPEFLVALYLTAVLERVLPLVVHQYPDISEHDLLFNIDAPISDFSGDHSEALFRRALGASLNLLRSEATGSTPNDAWDLWRAARAEFENQEERQRRAFVVPESQAIIMGSAEIGDIRGDIYKAVVDIGAGTTDVAFFKLVERKGKQPRLYFFSAGTRAYGCNDIDLAFVNSLDGESGGDRAAQRRLLDGIRANKLDLLAGTAEPMKWNGLLLNLDPEIYEDCCHLGAEEIFSHYRRMCGQAYALERAPDRWSHLRLIIAGGGSVLPAVRNRFRSHPKDFGESVSRIDLARTHKIAVRGASDSQPRPEEMPFLLTVLGLATPKQQMPIPVDPEKIKPMPVTVGPTGLYGWEAPDDVG